MLHRLGLGLLIVSALGCSQGNGKAGEVNAMPVNDNAKVEPVATLVAKNEQLQDKLAKKGLFEGELLLEPSTAKAMDVTLRYTNTQSYGVPIMFNSGMTADLWLINANGTKVWAWSNEMMFTQAIRETVMPAGKTQQVKFRIAADVAATIGKGFYLKAIFSGRATESTTPALEPVIYKF